MSKEIESTIGKPPFHNGSLVYTISDAMDDNLKSAEDIKNSNEISKLEQTTETPQISWLLLQSLYDFTFFIFTLFW